MADAKKYIDGFNASYSKVPVFFENIIAAAGEK